MDIIKRGITLFVFSILYIGGIGMIISIYHQPNFINSYRYIITLIYISVWIFEGYQLKKGFIKGLIAGIIGSTFGLSIILWIGFSLNKVSPEVLVAKTIPWNIPLIPITGSFYTHTLTNTLAFTIQMVSILFLVLITATSSYVGELLDERKKLNQIFGEKNKNI